MREKTRTLPKMKAEYSPFLAFCVAHSTLPIHVPMYFQDKALPGTSSRVTMTMLPQPKPPAQGTLRTEVRVSKAARATGRNST